MSTTKLDSSSSMEKIVVDPPESDQSAPGERPNPTQSLCHDSTMVSEKCLSRDDTEANILKGTKKRTMSASSAYTDDDASSLTPLTSPTEVRAKPVFPPTTNIAPRLARQFMRAQAQAQAQSRESMASKPRTNLLSTQESIDSLFPPLDSTDDESVDDTDVGSLVWVCIDMESRLSSCDAEGGSYDALWWPAKVFKSI